MNVYKRKSEVDNTFGRYNQLTFIKPGEGISNIAASVHVKAINNKKKSNK